MAQPSNRTSRTILDSSSTLDSTASYPLPDPRKPSNQAQIHCLDIKEELYNNGSDTKKVDTTSNPPPKKRQKTAEQGCSRKFVSQQKWKFIDGQPWLTSRLSTKAQNASQALVKYKTETTVAKRSTSPDTPRHTIEASEQTTCTQPGYNNDSKAQQSLLCPSKPEKRSKALQQRPKSSVGQTSSKEHLVTSGSTVLSPPSRPSTMLSDSSVWQSQQGSEESANGLSNTPGFALASGERATGGKPRTVRSVSTLSLEKDADRIAALISEKKKENESSRFRERMLQRQLQHRDQQDAGAELEPNASKCFSLRDSRSTTRDSSQGSEGHISAKVDGLLIHHDVSPPQHSTSYNKNAPSAVGHSHLTKTSEVSRREIQEKPSNPTTFGTEQFTSPASFRPPLVQNEHEILFGRQLVPKSVAKNDRHRIAETGELHDTVPQPRNGSGPFEAEDADTATHLVAFTNQFLPKRVTREPQAQHMNSTQRPRSQYFNGPGSSSLSSVHSQTLQRANSTSSAQGRMSIDGFANMVPSPMSLSSSQSPTSLPAQQLAHIDISAQSQQALVYPSSATQNRAVLTGQTSSHAMPAYHSISRPTWTFSQKGGENNVINPAAQSVQFSASASWNMPSGFVQQRSSPTSVPTSDQNAPNNNNTRLGASSDEKKNPSKPRVNMFSNTKGTPFPMQEVIRQIEMT